MKKIILSITLIGSTFGLTAQENKIESTGNVGIGTITPNAPLSVKSNSFSSSNSGFILEANNSNNALVKIAEKSTNGARLHMYEEGIEKIAFYTDGTNNHISAGNLGIGTTNPSEKLQIENGIVKVRNNNNSDRFIWSRTDNTMKAGLAGDGGRKLFFLANDLTQMTIDGLSGNVGIGTISPDMKLTVNGNIHAKEVKIDLNIPAPDYVFKEDYHLRSIEDLENFIKENSHLPEIPSAMEFEQNGVMQAEMDMNLLKKVEELTLYLIQQQKEIESLKEENEEVKLLNTKLLELQSRLEKLESEK